MLDLPGFVGLCTGLWPVVGPLNGCVWRSADYGRTTGMVRHCLHPPIMYHQLLYTGPDLLANQLRSTFRIMQYHLCCILLTKADNSTQEAGLKKDHL